MDWIDAALTVGEGGTGGDAEDDTPEETAAKKREEVSGMYIPIECPACI